MVNVLPLPNSLSNPTLPPNSRASSLTIESPSPVPPYSGGHRILLAGESTPLAELLEDRFLVVQWDAHAVVFNHQVDLPGVVTQTTDTDPPPFGGELDGIGEQVEQDLFELADVLEQQRGSPDRRWTPRRCSSFRPAERSS
ncbi:MAG: hypothetical protein Ct9H300mP1_04610 [Planctomycetaceae bacterium]|nr:MAG: hypothetical protein Ct9H300mP1_04610 [Planctomycetaceae bacterium]